MCVCERERERVCVMMRQRQRIQPYDPNKRLRSMLKYCCAILGICAFLYYMAGMEAESILLSNDALDRNRTSFTSALLKGSPTKKGHSRGKFSSKAVGSLLKDVLQAREEYVDQMKVHYGEYYEKMFVMNDTVTSRGYASFGSPPPADTRETSDEVSRVRFQRKILLKVLRAWNDKDGVRFVWSTGGHSAAAGHGNYHNQSYTAFMERAVKPVFARAGVDFEGRNYAMGGMPSGPELAPCLEAVYGLDADVISWDFGMTDAGMYWRKAWYDVRVAKHPNRPTAVGINLDGGVSEGDSYPFQMWTHTPRKLEEIGITTLYLKRSAWGDIKKIIPDMFGMNSQQINETPEYVRHFKCQNKIEKGDPTCDDNRFMIPPDTENCDTHKGRVDWHPGWYVMFWGCCFTKVKKGSLLTFYLAGGLKPSREI